VSPALPLMLSGLTTIIMLDIGERRMQSYRRNQFSNTASVASGLQRTGGLITSLALLLIIVVGAFSASGITFIKLMGVGMIVALLVDATIIRVLLVPATMRLLGRANW
jgi:trehalose monomycolate/heme transporter